MVSDSSPQIDARHEEKIIPKKLQKEQLPTRVDNGCVIIDDTVTEEDLINLIIHD